MTKVDRLQKIKYDIRDRMVCAVFEAMAHTRLVAMEVSQEQGTVYKHGDHTWEITRVQSIWVIYCKGLYNWNVQFDVDWFIGPCGDRFMGIDTFVFNENALIDTKDHLTMAMEFVSNFIADTEPTVQ